MARPSGLDLSSPPPVTCGTHRTALASAKVAVPAGFVPESGGARNLPKLVGIGRAMEMILTGEIIDAQEAVKIGLVERYFEHDKLLTKSLKLPARSQRRRFCRCGRQRRWFVAIGTATRARRARGLNLKPSWRLREQGIVVKEIDAFLNKRPPVYRGPSYRDGK